MPNVKEMVAKWHDAMEQVTTTMEKGQEAGYQNLDAWTAKDDDAWHVVSANLTRAEELQQRIAAARGHEVPEPVSGSEEERYAACKAWGEEAQPQRTKVVLSTEFGPEDSAVVKHEGKGGMMFRDETTGKASRALAPEETIVSGVDGASHEIGEYLQAKLTGRAYAGAMKTTDIEGGGALLPETYSSRLVDLARANSVCVRAGGQTLPMGGPELIITRVASEPTPNWRPEGSSVTASGMTFDRVTLRAKTLAAIVPVTLELMEDASNFPQVVEGAVAAAMGVKLDYACLAGSGASSEPQGVYNYTTVNEVATVGTPTNYTEVSSAVGEILADNYPGDVAKLAWIQNPRDAETYDQLVDTTNQPLRPTPWVEKLRRFHTTSMDTDQGSGSDSWAVVGDFREMVIGMRTSGVMIRIIDAGSVTDDASKTHNAVDELKFYIVAHMRADMALLRPTWFCKLTGITA